jgi:hypothetical protein
MIRSQFYFKDQNSIKKNNRNKLKNKLRNKKYRDKKLLQHWQ